VTANTSMFAVKTPAYSYVESQVAGDMLDSGYDPLCKKSIADYWESKIGVTPDSLRLYKIFGLQKSGELVR
jgi:hypothetical protein